jgi:hypothetical protein
MNPQRLVDVSGQDSAVIYRDDFCVRAANLSDLDVRSNLPPTGIMELLFVAPRKHDNFSRIGLRPVPFDRFSKNETVVAMNRRRR